MVVTRTTIEAALDELIAHEEGVRFQALAVILAKRKWPELIAHERKKDRGLDAYAPPARPGDGTGRGLACSISLKIFEKLKSDAETARENFPDLRTLVFATPHRVSQLTAQNWAEELLKNNEIKDVQLIVMPREEFVTSLLEPNNASLCQSILSIPLEITGDETALLTNVNAASSLMADRWRARTRTQDRPTISLSGVKLDDAGKETDERFGEQEIRDALWQSRRLSIEAPGGRGKTTTLARLATKPRAGEVFLLVDLPAWIQSGEDVLGFLAREPEFRARKVSADDLASLQGRLHFSFLLNGWNEVAEALSATAIVAVNQLDHQFPDAGIAIATRAHPVSPPLAGCIRTRLLSLSREQRAEYLRQVLGESATKLRDEIEGSRVLDELTCTPLLLTQVVSLYQSSTPIPDTRVGVLEAATKLIEAEHRAQLQIAPISNCAAVYLAGLAASMTERGEIIIQEEAANQAIQMVNAALLNAARLVSPPNPDSILQVLCAHHVLERLENPTVSFRFQHQQFQEFYASRFLLQKLIEIVGAGDANAHRTFSASYIDKPLWEEALLMVAEDVKRRAAKPISRSEAEALGASLIGLTSTVDPIFAGELARNCGPELWPSIRGDLGAILRRWYTAQDSHHRQLALAAMFATAAEEFGGIIELLLTSENHQARLSAYHAGRRLHLTTLGANWRQTINGWSEGARSDFVNEFFYSTRRVDIIEEFARTDPSLKIRLDAIRALCWLEASSSLGSLIARFNEQELEAVLSSVEDELLPPDSRPAVAAALRRSVRFDTPPINSLRFLHRARLLDSRSEVEQVKAALDRLTGRAEQPEVIQAALADIQIVEPDWVADWVATKLAEGMFRGESWHHFLRPPSQTRRRAMIEELATTELSYNQLAAYIAVFGTETTLDGAKELFVRLRQLQGSSLKDTWKYERQLQDALRAMRPGLAIAGMSTCLTQHYDQDTFATIVDLLGHVGQDAEDLRTSVEASEMAQLRRYLKEGIAFIVEGGLLSADTRSRAAVSLARIGTAADVVDLRAVINADIERLNAHAKGARMIYANWYILALRLLDAVAAEEQLLQLFDEPHYEGEVVRAFVQLAVPVTRDSPWGGNRTNYKEIWARRSSEPRSGFDEARATRYANAIRQRIEQLQPHLERGDATALLIGRMKGLAHALAVLDGKRSASIVIETMRLPGRWDGHLRSSAVAAVLMSGATLPLEGMRAVLDPPIENFFASHHNQESEYFTLFSCLELFPFSDDPEQAVAHIREILTRLKFRPHHFRNLIEALGYSRADAVVPLLIDFARDNKGFPNFRNEGVAAMGRLGTPSARRTLLAVIDPEVPASEIPLQMDYHVERILVASFAAWAREDSQLRARFIQLASIPLSAKRRHLLVMVLGELGEVDVLLSMPDFVGNDSILDAGRGSEAVFLERKQHGEGSYTLEPRNAAPSRKKLFEMVLSDPCRRDAAVAALGRIEVWRLDIGRPPGEPRHPSIESGVPWPPLDLMRLK